MNSVDILKKLGIDHLSPMQEEARHAIGEGHGDVVLLSPTGSGKTLAYLLPLCSRLNADTDAVQAMVVVPGRELAMQSQQVMQRMGTGLRSMSVYGGRPAMDEHRQMRLQRPQVVFGTPGRLNDHLSKGNINPHGVAWLVIDEFDKCLEMGFEAEMSRLLQRLPDVRRRVLLSATDAAQIPSFVRLDNVQRIVATEKAMQHTEADRQTQQRIATYTVRSADRDKLATLNALLRSLAGQKAIVFLNLRQSVVRTADYLRRCGFMPAVMHGGMEQSLREEQLYLFANGSLCPLVSTDLASRGLDIPDVQAIVHYHLPETSVAAIHRSGRTARWQATGNTYFILGPGERLPEELAAAGATEYIPENANVRQRLLLPPMATIYIGKGRRDKISRGDIVGFLCKKGGLRAEQLGRIDVYEHHAYAAVSRQAVAGLLSAVRDERIKGLRTVVELKIED